MTGRRNGRVIDETAALRMLAGSRIAVVGASDSSGNFARTVYLALRARGAEPVAVHPTAGSVDGHPCYASLAQVPVPIDLAIVMVPAPAAVQVVRECATQGIGTVWLFKGLGGSGAVSDEAIAVAEELGLDVVPGACPMMFLQPVSWLHRIHRTGRRRNRSVVAAP